MSFLYYKKPQEASGNRGQKKTWHLPWTRSEESSQFCVCQIMLLRNLSSLGDGTQRIGWSRSSTYICCTYCLPCEKRFLLLTTVWKLLCAPSLSPLKKIQWSPIEKSWRYKPGLLFPAPFLLNHPLPKNVPSSSIPIWFSSSCVLFTHLFIVSIPFQKVKLCEGGNLD